MANHEIKNPPEFVQAIRKFEITDKGHADLFNDVVNPLINNDVFLKEELQEESSRAQAAEETNKNNLTNHVDDKINPHKVTKAQVGLGNVDNTADINKPISTAQQNALDSAYQQATEYTDQKIADLIGGAPETLDTLKEVADAIQANKEVSTALDAAIGKKADKTALDTHTADSTIHITSAERTNWNDANTKKHTHSNKGVLDKITQALLDSWNAAYSHISDAVKHITAAERTLWNTVGNKVDKVSGKGLSTNDYTTAEKSKLAGIAANANNYTHPTTAGNKHIPSGGSSGQILRWSADGTAAWGSDNNTTYSTATQSANGLLSAADKKKLDGIATNANNYTHPTTAGNKHIPSGGSSGQILRWSADGTAAWGSDNNTTYSNMTAATASAAGKAGLVPAPAAGKQTSFLRGDGTWATPTDTNTWRGITDSLTSTSTTISLSAKAGKSLKDSIDTINGNLTQNTAGKFILPNGLKICWGNYTPPNANGYIRQGTITFPVSFSSIPHVFVTKVVDNSYLECRVTVACSSQTKTNVSIKAMYDTEALRDTAIQINWFAIGY